MKSLEIIKNILIFLKPYKNRIFIAMMALITVVLSMLMLGRSIKFFIDYGFSTNDSDAKHIHVIYEIIFLILVFGIGSFIRSYIINTTAELVANDVRKKSFYNLSFSSLDLLKKYDYSDIGSRITSDSEYLSKIIIDLTSFFIRNFMLSTGGMIMMIYTAPKLSTISLMTLTIIALLASRVGKIVRKISKDAEYSKSLVTKLVYETILNSKIISSFSVENSINGYFDILNKQNLDKTMQRLAARSSFFAISITSIMLSITFIIWYGSKQVVSGDITAGTLGSFMFYSIMMATSFGGLVEMFGDLQKNLANCERIFEIINFKPQKDDIEKKIILNKNYNIIFNNVSFAYENEDVIKSLNLKIEQGKFYAIKGKSGVGKTTFIQILLGILKPSDGYIKISEEKFSYLTTKLWKGQIAYVPQDTQMFSGTIIDNLFFFNENKNYELAHSILKKLDLSEYVSSLTNGLDTDLGAMASQISGGQRQRLAIARSLIAKPEILILDESTSQLDVKTEKLVLDFIKEFMKGKTVISIAHRPNALEIADEIIDFSMNK